MTPIELILTAGAVVTAYGIGRTIGKTKIKELKNLVDAETYKAKQHEDNATFWREMYKNTVRKANGHEPKNLVKNG